MYTDTTAEKNNKNDKIAFQGSKGSFSESALMRFFGQEQKRIACEDFDKVFALVANDKCDFGIVPIENSLIGTINACFDKFLIYKDISVVGHTTIQIEHALIGLPHTKLSDITTVYSQIQGLEQCTHFLSKHKINLVPFSDTAAAVEHVAQEKNIHKAAVASERAAKIYNLNVLVKNIENNPQNFTRFVIIKKQKININTIKNDLKKEGYKNIQTGFIIFTTPDSPGALLECLKIFSTCNINLHKIESRPIAGKPWEYQFVVEIDLQHKQSDVVSALDVLSKTTHELHIVGLYNKH